MELNILLKSGEVITVAKAVVKLPICHLLRQRAQSNNTFTSFNYDDDITEYILGAASGNVPAIEPRRWARLARLAWEDADDSLFTFMSNNVPDNVDLYLVLRVAALCEHEKLCDKVLCKLDAEYEWWSIVDIFIEYGNQAEQENIDWIFSRWRKLGRDEFDIFNIKYRLLCAYGYNMKETLQHTDFSQFTLEELDMCSVMNELGHEYTNMFACMYKIMYKNMHKNMHNITEKNR